MKLLKLFIFVLILSITINSHALKNWNSLDWKSFSEIELEEKVKNILHKISSSYRSHSLIFYSRDKYGVVFEVQDSRGKKEFIKLHYPCNKLTGDLLYPKEIRVLKALNQHYRKRIYSSLYILEYKMVNGLWFHVTPWYPITLEQFLLSGRKTIHQNDVFIKNILAQLIKEAAVIEKAGWINNAIKIENIRLSHTFEEWVNHDRKQLFAMLTNYNIATEHCKYRKDLDEQAVSTAYEAIGVPSPSPADDSWDIGIIFLQLVIPEGYDLSSNLSRNIMEKLSEHRKYHSPADIVTYCLCWNPIYPALDFKYISLYQHAFGGTHRLYENRKTKHCLSRRGFEFMCKMFETDRDRRLWPSQLLKEPYLKKTIKKLKATTKDKKQKPLLGVTRDGRNNRLIIRKIN